MINLTITENGCSCQHNPALEGNLEWGEAVMIPSCKKIDSGDPERDEEYRKQKISYQKKRMKTSKAIAKGESPQARAERLAQWWMDEGNHPQDALDFVLLTEDWLKTDSSRYMGTYLLITGDGRIISLYRDSSLMDGVGIIQKPQSPRQESIFPVQGEVFCLHCASRYVTAREGALTGRLKIIDIYSAFHGSGTHNCICGSYEDHSLYYVSPRYGYRPKCDVLRDDF